MLREKLSPRFVSDLFILLCLALLSSCGFRAPRIGDYRYDSFEPLPFNQSVDLLESIKQSTEHLQNVRIFTQTTLRDGLFSQNVDQVVVIDRPNKMRMETQISGTGQLVELTLLRGNEVEIFNQKENKIAKGIYSAQAAQTLFGAPLPPEDIMLLLVGRLSPRITASALANPQVKTEKNRHDTFLVETNLEQGLELVSLFKQIKKDGISYPLLSNLIIRSQDTGKELLVGNYDYRLWKEYPLNTVGAQDDEEEVGFYPLTITINRASDGTTATLRFISVIVNKAISNPDKVFFLNPSASTEIVPLNFDGMAEVMHLAE